MAPPPTNQLILYAFDSKKALNVRAVFLDISKSYDKLRPDGLIFKMKQNGVPGRLLKHFQSYLNNRKQRMVLDGFSADYSTIG